MTMRPHRVSLNGSSFDELTTTLADLSACLSRRSQRPPRKTMANRPLSLPALDIQALHLALVANEQFPVRQREGTPDFPTFQQLDLAQ